MSQHAAAEAATQSRSDTDSISPLSHLRRLPAVDPEPPFDDETLRPGDAGHAVVIGDGQSVLALAFALPNGLPNVPAVPGSWTPDVPKPATAPGPQLRLVPAGVAGGATRPRRHRRSTARTIEEEFGPQPTPRAQLPEPQLWAARLVQAFVEVNAGLRPASQLIRWTTTAVQEAIGHHSDAANPADPDQPADSGTRQQGGTRQLGGTRQQGGIVRSVRASEPVDGVVEVSAVVQRGDRCRAIALRLEGIDGRWQCTALQLG